jgi:hypothetical protein
MHASLFTSVGVISGRLPTQAISTIEHYYCVVVMCPLLVKEKEKRKKII